MTQRNGPNGSLSRIYFKNALIIDGTGDEPVRGGLLVEGDRLKQGGEIHPEPRGADTTVIDLGGKASTLLPGMVLAHVHLSYNHVKDLPDLDLKQPAEVSTIAAVCNARTMLDCGFTSGLSAGALHMVD